GNKRKVKGPKEELTKKVHEGINRIVEDQEVIVERADERKQTRSLHGTTRSLIANMIEGVDKGFEKKLAIIGVGYRAQKKGNKVVINAGYSHPEIGRAHV